MGKESTISLGPNNLYAATKATLVGKKGYTKSDAISIAGLALIFPETMVNENENINTTIANFVSLETTLDNTADEGPGIDSYHVGRTNKDQFTFLRDVLIKSNQIPVEVLQNAGGFLRQCWTVENYAHQHAPNFSHNEQKEYRELINALWTRTYVSFVSGITNNTIDYYGNIYSPDFNNGLPSFDELIEPGRESYSTIASLYKNFIDGDYQNIPEGVSSYALYLLVMETSNWYDNQLNPHNQEHTPRIRENTNEYREKLAQIGIPLPVTNGIFLAAKVAMQAMRTKSRIKKLL